MHRARPLFHPPIIVLAALLLAAGASPPAALAQDEIDLSGSWGFRMDPRDEGVEKKWFDEDLTERIALPGSMAGNGLGDDVTVETRWTGGIVDRSWFTDPRYAEYRKPGSVKVPFWLTPVKHYVGPAWYARDVEVPPAWGSKRIVLTLERCHWETRLWVDGNEVSRRDSLSTPHRYDLTGRLGPGRHRLALRVDNRVKIAVGENAHSVSDHTQGNWNGIAGKIALSAGPLAWIDDLQVHPDLKAKSARLVLGIGHFAAAAGRGTLTLNARTVNSKVLHDVPPLKVPFEFHGTSTEVSVEYPLGPTIEPWDEFSPALYELQADIEVATASVRTSAFRTVRFGMRELGQEGTQFTVNGRRTFLRGTLECCIFPLTGHPPADVASWKRIIGVAKAHGLNHFRFHSFCPPEAAFTAADELGFYYHVECAAWADVDDRGLQEFIRAESDRILREYGNHPSFCFLAYGNEPGGKGQNEFLSGLVRDWKAKDPRRKYTTAAGWPVLPGSDYHSTPEPRIQSWGGGLKSRINARPPETVTDYADFAARHAAPVVSHEIGQWCVYPNFKEISKYTGVLKARNFEIFRDDLAAKGLLDQAEDFLLSSGKLQAACYKEEIESALRSSGFGGFQLLDLHDFPGQGTALVGVLDPFWDSKGYITAEEYHRFAGETVPLALLPKRVFTEGETLAARVKVAHFGPAPIRGARIAWSLKGVPGDLVAGGDLGARDIPIGNEALLGEISVSLPRTGAARKLVLTISIAGTPYSNDWGLWVYPERLDLRMPPGVTVVDELGEEALKALGAGGKVLWTIPRGRVKGDRSGRVALGFSSIFWNTAWTGRQAPHTLGVLCDPRHPALAGFPTESHSDWQWWYIVSRAEAMILDGLPRGLRPVVQVIDDWFTNRRLGLVLEARAAGGRILVTSIDLKGDLGENPVARQMLHGLFSYMSGDRFQPAVEVPIPDLKGLAAPPSAIGTLGARVSGTDSAEPGHGCDQAIDGDPSTMWHTAWTAGAPAFPHEIWIEFQREAALSGITLLPRQDGNRNGWIKEYAVYVSGDGKDWGVPAARGSLPADEGPKTVLFDGVRRGRHLKLVALSGQGIGPFASLAELEVIEAR